MEKFEFLELVGARVMHRRKLVNMTQAELAKRMGLRSSAFICEFEKGRRTISAHTLYRMHKELGGILEGL